MSWNNPLLFSLAAALLTLGLKFAAYLVTGSVGLLSDAAESVINVIAALTALISLYYASLPADSTHTYGHEKIEFFSSGVEGVLILVAAFAIGWYAVRRLIHPHPLESLDIGSAINLAATLVNLAVARYLLRRGRSDNSLIMVAHGRHIMTDVWTSFGVLVGLGLVWLTKVGPLDPIIALLVALNIAWTGLTLLRTSFNGLMDHALPEEELASVRKAIESQLEPGMDYHALRTRMAGSRKFADFHLLVPGKFTVKRSHELIGRIESAVKHTLRDIEVYVHVEPIEDRAAWEDSELLPIEQAERVARGEG